MTVDVEKTVVRVRMLDAPYNIDKEYDYNVPEEFSCAVKVGSFVIAPFGTSNRKSLAVVSSIPEKSSFGRLKNIISLAGAGISLNSEMLGLCAFMKEHTFCTYGDAVRSMLPVSSFSKLENDIENNSKTEYFSVSPEYSEMPRDELLKIKLLSRSEKQRALLALIYDRGIISYPELKASEKDVKSTLDALLRKGLLCREDSEKYNDPHIVRKEGNGLINTLNECQSAAYSKLCGLYESGEAKAALLHGITGSGKTRVMISIIDRVIADGRAAIVLIPEISLTPQTIGLFGAYYGEKIAVWHSALSAGEKLDAWRRMKSGNVKVCIGTRSAIFAPFEDIGLVVIDEEQEHTYKSDMNPKYHARDIARYRCAHHKALMLLASATPSLESYYKAKSGIYTLIEMKERYGNAELPKAIIADMRIDSSKGSVSAIGSVLYDNLKNNIEKDEQSILFINRRGYNNFLNCPVCGEVIMCPHCSVSLTYHAEKGSGGKSGYMFCHYCGYKQNVPEKCPSCGNEHMRYVGFGTQKVEDEICETLCGAKVVRMDADTTSKKDSYGNIIDGFRKGDGNILLGTQMVTKGHDFPKVSLVGVLLADMTLYLDDYHANERSFALITQVIGRAGRGDIAGRAVIQTYSPDNPTLKFAAVQDYEGFYKNEIALRKALVFPPFCDMFLIGFSSSSEEELHECTARFANRMRELLKNEYKDIKLVLFGPFEAPVYKLNEKYRMRFVAKGVSNSKCRAMLRDLINEFYSMGYRKTLIGVDVNPNNL